MYHHVSKMLESMKTVWRSWISSAKHVDTLEITTGIRIFTFAALLYALSGSIRPNATTPSGQIYHCLNPLLYFPPWAVSSPCESSATYERTTNGISGDERVRTHTILNIAHVRRRSSCCVRTYVAQWLRGASLETLTQKHSVTSANGTDHHRASWWHHDSFLEMGKSVFKWRLLKNTVNDFCCC